LILAGCSSSYFLNIQTYPSIVPENDIGSFDIHFWRYSFDRFWNTIDYDLKKDIMLYKDSVKVCYQGQIKEVVYIEEPYRKDNFLKLSNKGRIAIRFYFYTQQGDTVMMYTKNAFLAPSGVLPLDSVQFIHGERFKLKDNFVRRKGNPKYGYYTISL